jgi:ZIP family zinc transporter
MGEAIGWGALAASSLVIGALLASLPGLSKRGLGLVLAFGAGALISAVSFELAEEGAQIGGPGSVAIGLGVGAITYFLANRSLDRRSALRKSRTGHSQGSDAGTALALGAFLDGIPEQLVLGIGIALGQGVSVGLLVAIFVSNLPESVGSARLMETAGTPHRSVLRLWIGVAVICVAATALGYALADVASDNLKAAINGFAAGALLVMLVDSMIPEAVQDAARDAGLATALGFALSAGLSGIG